MKDIIKKYQKYLIPALLLIFIIGVFWLMAKKPWITEKPDGAAPSRTIAPAPPVKAKNVWNNVVPGQSKYSAVKSVFGDLKATEKTYGGKTMYKYTNGGDYVFTTVVADEAGAVEYVRTPNFAAQPADLDGFLVKLELAEPDLKLYTSFDEGEVVYVYLKAGVAFEVNPFVRETHYIRYFVPVSKEDFLKTVGSDLSVSPKSIPHI